MGNTGLLITWQFPTIISKESMASVMIVLNRMRAGKPDSEELKASNFKNFFERFRAASFLESRFTPTFLMVMVELHANSPQHTS